MYYIKLKCGKCFCGLVVNNDIICIDFNDYCDDVFKFATFTKAFNFLRFIMLFRNLNYNDVDIVKE